MKHKNEMQRHLISFALMIFFTILAFLSVFLELDKYFITPFILLLGVVQVLFQLFIFMHMEHEGHEWAIGGIFSGVFVSFTILVALMLLI